MKIDTERHAGGPRTILENQADAYRLGLGRDAREIDHEYMTTREAAEYLRKSVSWLLRQRDVAYIPGKPNLYEKRDLDGWMRKHKVTPRVRV